MFRNPKFYLPFVSNVAAKVHSRSGRRKRGGEERTKERRERGNRGERRGERRAENEREERRGENERREERTRGGKREREERGPDEVGCCGYGETMARQFLYNKIT